MERLEDQAISNMLPHITYIIMSDFDIRRKMTKVTRQFLILILLMLGSTVLFSCSTKQRIIGKWEDIHNPNNMVEFTKDHDFSQILFGQTSTCPIEGCLAIWKNYEYSGQEIKGRYNLPEGGIVQIISSDYGNLAYEFKFSKGNLILTDSNGNSWTYHQVNSKSAGGDSVLALNYLLLIVSLILLSITGFSWMKKRLSQVRILQEASHQVGYCESCHHVFSELEIKEIAKKSPLEILSKMIGAYPYSCFCPNCFNSGLFWSENFQSGFASDGTPIPKFGTGTGSRFGIKIIKDQLIRRS
jgi:hypothetical protein